MKRAHTPPAKARTTTESAQTTTDQFQAEVRLRAYQLYEPGKARRTRTRRLVTGRNRTSPEEGERSRCLANA